MYISLRQKRKIVTSFVFLLFLAVFVFLLVRDYSVGLEPQGVVLSNVRENGVTVSWVTYSRVNSSLVLYQNGERIGEFRDSRGSGKSYTHYVDISNLSPGVSYEFEIISAGRKILNNQERFAFSTSNVSSEISPSRILRGTVDSNEALVFLVIDDLTATYPVSTYVTGSGEWYLDIAKLGSADINSDFSFRPDTPLKLLFYSNDGVRVIQGNSNILFDEGGVFKEEIKLDRVDNIFSYIPEYARFKDAYIPLRHMTRESEVIQESTENILGVVDEEDEDVFDEDDQSERRVGTMEKMEHTSDYGFN